MTIVALNFWPWHWSLDVTGKDEYDEDGLRKSEDNESQKHQSRDDSSEEGATSEDSSEPHQEVDGMAKSVPKVWNRLKHSIDLQSRLRRCLLLAALACILRPTNVMIWICLVCFTVFRMVSKGSMLSLPWEGMQFWAQLTFPSLLPSARLERIRLLREVIVCGYEH